MPVHFDDFANLDRRIIHARERQIYNSGGERTSNRYDFSTSLSMAPTQAKGPLIQPAASPSRPQISSARPEYLLLHEETAELTQSSMQFSCAS